MELSSKLLKSPSVICSLQERIPAAAGNGKDQGNTIYEMKQVLILHLSHLSEFSKLRDEKDGGRKRRITTCHDFIPQQLDITPNYYRDRVNAAIEVLKSISSKVIDALDDRPIFTGEGINERFFGQSSCTLCSSGRNGDDGRLLCACQVIIDAFNEAGLVLEKDATQKLKLYASVMNARHGKSKSRTRKLDSFDARGIFKQYGSEEWGEYIIPKAHLSQRFVFDESGYYHCRASIPFLENKKAD
ncbi:hypothetical protein Pint_29709 [Pistacia integerrima]|uniref:Uncharacterized protein n=1 Tax=Pistacia integerrima TaxID=434235 RepID=A0ACC0X2V6_9ROSI|nr:hypothetical protein Pint_29709 [Pistacia integerrima]